LTFVERQRFNIDVPASVVLPTARKKTEGLYQKLRACNYGWLAGNSGNEFNPAPHRSLASYCLPSLGSRLSHNGQRKCQHDKETIVELLRLIRITNSSLAEEIPRLRIAPPENLKFDQRETAPHVPQAERRRRRVVCPVAESLRKTVVLN